MITVEGSQAAAVQLRIEGYLTLMCLKANKYRGTYFDAPGTFACVGAVWTQPLCDFQGQNR